MMYFKVRCVRESYRVLITIVTFLASAYGFSALLRPLVYALFAKVLNDGLLVLLTLLGAIAIQLGIQALLGIYKVYEFRDRDIQIQWW